MPFPKGKLGGVFFAMPIDKFGFSGSTLYAIRRIKKSLLSEKTFFRSEKISLLWKYSFVTGPKIGSLESNGAFTRFKNTFDSSEGF